MKIQIIEDEKPTARDLAHAIRFVEPDVEILPFIHSVEDGIFFLKQQSAIDLIFSDVDLGDGLCFEIFEAVPPPAAIVFCTAYEHYTLQAFQSFGIDYILKPIQWKDVEKALLKFKRLQQKLSERSHTYSQLLETLKTDQVQSNAILIHQADKIFTLHERNIALFFIEENHVYAYTFDLKRYLTSEKLETLEQKFIHFFRVNRQCLLNRSAVKDASQYFHRKLVVNLHFPFSGKIIVSRLKVNDFLAWLTQG